MEIILALTVNEVKNPRGSNKDVVLLRNDLLFNFARSSCMDENVNMSASGGHITPRVLVEGNWPLSKLTEVAHSSDGMSLSIAGEL